MVKLFDRMPLQKFVGVISTVMIAGLVLAASPVNAEGPQNFHALREQLAKTEFEAVQKYLEQNPDAEDAVDAYRFLFETALEHGLTVEASPLARTFLESKAGVPAADRSLARQVAMLALALEGNASSAIDLLGEELAVLRRVDPSAAIEASTSLAAAVQRGGKPEEAKAVYERLQRSFFLNPTVSLTAENRLARLALIEQALPELSLTDLEGREFSATDLVGKVVLIDFWATNCPPCLEELPELRRLYADFKDEGFEIVGISLDEDESTVRGYLEESSLPWRVALSSSDSDSTREKFQVETIPANFLIGRDGRVTRVDLHGEDLRSEVKRFVKERR